MKLIKSFLALMVFAVCAAFSYPVRATPKPIIVPLKTEKIIPVTARPTASVNFVRTDSLVMYEAAPQFCDQTANGRVFIFFNENFQFVRRGISRFFSVKPEFHRRVEIVFV